MKCMIQETHVPLGPGNLQNYMSATFVTALLLFRTPAALQPPLLHCLLATTSHTSVTT